LIPRVQGRKKMGQVHTMDIEGRFITYEVRISHRAKRLQMQIDPKIGLEVVIPHRQEGCDHKSFVLEHSRWVLRHLDALEDSRRRFPASSLEPGGSVVILGRPCPLEVEMAVGRGRATYVGGCIRVRANSATARVLKPPVEELLRSIAGEIMKSRADFWADVVGVTFSELKLSQARSAWGTCSHDGVLSLSWRLVMAPPEVLDYIVVHEIVHLLHFSHNKSFWAEVSRHAPDHKKLQKWLKKYGHLLTI